MIKEKQVSHVNLKSHEVRLRTNLETKCMAWTNLVAVEVELEQIFFLYQTFSCTGMVYGKGYLKQGIHETSNASSNHIPAKCNVISYSSSYTN